MMTYIYLFLIYFSIYIITEENGATGLLATNRHLEQKVDALKKKIDAQTGN